MRQVEAAELVWNVRMALQATGATCLKGLAAPEQRTRRAYEQMLAEDIVKRLGAYEILSPHPVPEGSDLFSAAAYGQRNLHLLGGQ